MKKKHKKKPVMNKKSIPVNGIPTLQDIERIHPIRIDHIDGLFAICNKEEKSYNVTKAAELVRNEILNIYLSRELTYIRDTDINLPSEINLNIQDLLSIIHRILRKSFQPIFVARFIMPKITYHIIVDYTNRQKAQIITLIFDNVRKVCISNTYGYNADTKDFYDILKSPFVAPVGTSFKNADMLLTEIIQDSHRTQYENGKLTKVNADVDCISFNRYSYDYEGIAIMYYLLIEYWHQIVNDLNNEEFHYTPYTEVEMLLFKKLLASVESDGSRLTAVANWKYIGRGDEMFDKLKNQPIPDFILFDDSDRYPLLDFNLKETDFIKKYIEKNNLLGLAEGSCDMLSKLSQPRYGNRFQMNIGDSKDSDRMFTITYDLYPDDDYLRLYLIYRFNEDKTFVFMIDYINLKEFDGIHNIANISSNILQRNYNSLYSDLNELINDAPDFIHDRAMIATIAYYLISTFIVLHDRPQRSRMISYTEKRKSSVSNNRSNVKTSQNETKESDNDENRWIIRRVLKPAKEAKALVEESNKHGVSSESHRQYTMEAWDRIGHTRTLKDGRVIYIEGTTCRRHSSLLTDTDGISIKIKL